MLCSLRGSSSSSSNRGNPFGAIFATRQSWQNTNHANPVARQVPCSGADTEATTFENVPMAVQHLHLACANGDIASAAALIARGISYNFSDKNGKLPLHQACHHGQTATAEMLLARGAQVDAVDDHQRTALHWASYKGHVNTIAMLLHQGADVMAETDDGVTPLHIAVERGHSKSAGLLLDNGADLNARDDSGNTPLIATRDDKMRMCLQSRATQAQRRKSNYVPLAMEVAAVDLTTTSETLHRLIARVYDPASACTLRQRATLTSSLLEAEIGSDVARFDALIQMKEAILSLTNHCRSQRRLSVKSANLATDYEQLDGMLVATQQRLAAAPAYTPTVVSLQHRVRASEAHLREAQRKWEKARWDLEQAQDEVRHYQRCAVMDIDEARHQLQLHQAQMQQALAELYNKPVSQLSIEQTHAFVQNISGVSLPVDAFYHHGIDGETLTSLSCLELHQHSGLQPLGLCHRVVHCARLAAASSQPQLLGMDFDAAVDSLRSWLEHCEENVGAKYCKHLHALKVDILTSSSLHSLDLQHMGVLPKDRQDLIRLFFRASMNILSQTSSGHGSRRSCAQTGGDQAHGLSDQSRHEVPPQLRCPITMDIMADPVLAEDGHVYEREAIAAWQQQTGVSPMTRKAIGATFMPVLAMRQMAQDAGGRAK
eukprot:TRINITY_DN10577_c0_g1_i3.p1 TRINITY_DN10577_c0_g1~~TRINITY_DN10577_c0_g1_i3.p1  ORF type:complete len:658 (+),score=114.14 TRINITY_DN10577_c0_g1_i3:229-2202(+)